MNAASRVADIGLGEYEALLFHWHARHSRPGNDNGDAVNKPSREQVERSFSKIPRSA